MKKQRYPKGLKRSDFITVDDMLRLRPKEPKGRWKVLVLYNQEQDYMEEASFHFKGVESINIRELGWSEKWIILGEL